MRFQLHHTGIKTYTGQPGVAYIYDFNCTIQELKRYMIATDTHAGVDFNCTIQELKHIVVSV